MKRIILGLFLAFTLQSCSDKLTINNLTNTKWVLSEWPGKTLPTVAQATLNFDTEGRIGGKSFCNGYGGNTTFENGHLKFSQIFGTKMYCEEVGQAETKYTEDLGLVNTAKIVDGKLQLLKDSQIVMIFNKAE